MTPLARRLPRELKRNIGKYLGIFLLMTGSIALTSGFLLAAHSIQEIMGGMRDEYSIEDGRFATAFEATDAQLDAAGDAADGVGGVDIYPNFSIDSRFDLGDGKKDLTLRSFAHREGFDVAAYCEGGVPTAADEVAVDRVFAANNGIEVGDALTLEGRVFRVCGIMTQPDSQALFPDNSSFTVNTITYGVAEVSPDGFRALEDAGGAPTYTYSFLFRDRGLTVAQRTDAEKDMARALADANARVDDLLDADANQGIGYAADDVEGDSAMWATLLYIIVAIMAFVFVVLTGQTIEEESAVIGTLLASGYRRRELVAHYLALPCAVGLVSSVVGTALGLGFFTEPMRQLYYGSYSLPPFHVSWDWGIWVQTALVPFAVLVLITLAGLLAKIGKTPLQFLRHEASGKKGTKRGVKLPARMGFVARFRARVLLRNLGNFATLFVGIAFASVLLLFGLAVLPTMTHYADNLETSLVAKHQYALKAPLELKGTDEERKAWSAAERLMGVDETLLDEAQDASDELEQAADALQAAPSLERMQAAKDAQDTLYGKLDRIADQLGGDRDEAIDLIEDASGIDADDEDAHPVNTVDNGVEKISQAEKYAVYSLQYDRGDGAGEETVAVYGVSPGSRYWKDLGVGDGRVVFGRGLLDKFGFAEGDVVSLYDKYEDEWREVECAGESGAWGTKSNMDIYMGIDDFNRFFGNDAGYFNGYVSDEELDLDARYFASDTTPADMRAIGDQFVGMMDGLIGMMVGLAVFIYLLFMYLLTKAVIDRSARQISYLKVFGYRDREVSRLYIRSITICVAASLVLSLPLIICTLTAIFRAMLMSYSGNIEIYVPLYAMAQTVGIGFATYLVVAAIHTRTIKRVPLAEALKVQE